MLVTYIVFARAVDSTGFVTDAVPITITVVNTQPAIVYYYNDIAGTPVAATDENGTLLWDETYTPYGSRYEGEDGRTKNGLWYTGKPTEDATGLSYLGARWYNPAIGRFYGVDPVPFREGNPLSFNRYAYGNNNPYRFVDPDGRVPIDTIWDAINVVYDLGKVAYGAATGNAVLMAEGVSDLAVDTAALLVPYVPAGSTKLARAGGEVVEGVARSAANAAQGARLTDHLRQLEKYGSAGYKELANGRVRYYGQLESARRAGLMAGRRLVREWDPATGATRTWHETLDVAGRTRIVRPETGSTKVHYEFNEVGNYVGSW